MEVISGIYKIQSLLKPNRFYIGSSEHIKRRWQKHIQDLLRNKHHSPKLQYHFNKYGFTDFVLIILEPCFKEFLLIREQYYLDSLIPYFNTCCTAGNTLGFKHSEKTKVKMKNRVPWNKGTHGLYSEDYRNKLREKRKYFKHTEETKKKMSESHKGGSGWNKGIKTPQLVKDKISNSLKGFKRPTFTESHRDKLRIAGVNEWQKRENRTAWNKGKKKVNGKFVCLN